MNGFPAGILVVDSSTLLGASAAGQVAVCGSHGGVNAVLYAVAARARAAIFNDAGLGRQDAGIAGLRAAEPFGVAAAAVDYRSARIGDGEDVYRSGRISHHNNWAAAAGIKDGMTARQAAARLTAWAGTDAVPPPAPSPHPPLVICAVRPRIVVLDSISQVTDENLGDVVLSGSHGGVVAGRAVKVRVGAAFFNDAGIGKDGAGLSRLQLLQEQGIPAAVVDHRSARIGDGADTYFSGIITHANSLANDMGVIAGQSAQEAAERIRQQGGR